jgi:hypothetical protein
MEEAAVVVTENSHLEAPEEATVSNILREEGEMIVMQEIIEMSVTAIDTLAGEVMMIRKVREIVTVVAVIEDITIGQTPVTHRDPAAPIKDAAEEKIRGALTMDQAIKQRASPK